MHRLTPLLLPGLLCLTLLSACGMKGPLYESAPPAPPAAATEPLTGDAAAGDSGKGERKQVPATPDPALSR